MATAPPTDQPTRCTWRASSPSSGASSRACRSSAKSRMPPVASTGLVSLRPKPRRSGANPRKEPGSAARVSSQKREVDRLPCTKTTGAPPASPTLRTWVANRLVLTVCACTSTPFHAVVDEPRHRVDHVRRGIASLPQHPAHAEEAAAAHPAVRQCLGGEAPHLAGIHGRLQAAGVAGGQPPLVAAVQLLVHELRLATTGSGAPLSQSSSRCSVCRALDVSLCRCIAFWRYRSVDRLLGEPGLHLGHGGLRPAKLEVVDGGQQYVVADRPDRPGGAAAPDEDDTVAGAGVLVVDGGDGCSAAAQQVDRDRGWRRRGQDRADQRPLVDCLLDTQPGGVEAL